MIMKRTQIRAIQSINLIKKPNLDLAYPNLRSLGQKNKYLV